jgi:ribosomal subunit interface protein
MINKLEIEGVHMDVNDDLRKYANKKIGHLDKYISKHARVSAHAEVKLKESKAKNKDERTCEVILHLPKDNIRISESTVNIYAAIDIVEEKLKTVLHKYKALHDNPRLHQRLISRLKRQPA